MTDDRRTNAAKRIAAGWILSAVSILLLLYGGFNIVQGPRVNQIPPFIPLISLALGTSVLILGAILLIDGWTARWQAETKNRRAARESAGSGLGAASPGGETKLPSDVPGTGLSRPTYRGAIPGRKGLEKPATKRCPGCAKDVYKDARVCRYCGRAFGVTLRLKVYPPQDSKRRERVVGLLAKKLSMPADDVAHLLEMGMRFKYDSPEKLAAARTKFESLGCGTEVYEKAGRQ